MALLLTFLLSIVSVSAASLNLINDGKSTFTIVVPAQRHVSLSNAAQEMRLDLQLASGAKLEIVNDDAIAATKSSIISLGATKQAAAAGISAAGISDEGFRILTQNGNLYIIGPDTVEGQRTKNGGFSTGTANGVYSFLEKYLNVRWLMPGDLGRDVPKTTNLTLPQINDEEVPLFNLRELPFIQETLEPVKQWQERQKLRYYSMNFYYQHSWSKIVPESMFKEHPEWFALVNGSRKPRDVNYKLETTNSELVRYFADQVIAKLKADPHLVAYSLSPTDLQGWSESPESKKLYDPAPPESKYGSDRPSVTPLVLKFYHDVAKIVEKEYPQGRVSGYIYSNYLFPPQQGSMKLPENFIPVIAPSIDYGFRLYQKDARQTFSKLMAGWSKVVPTEWYYYDLPNTWMDAGKESHFQIGSTGIVTPAATRILDFIFPQLVQYHLRGSRIYGTESWSNVALANYIVAKMEWNPRLKASDLQKEWLTRAYGPQAGAVMERFYDKLEDAFEEYSIKEPINFRMTDDYLKGIYGGNYAELEKVLLEARNCSMTKQQQQRFELIEDNFIILQWRLRNKGYLKSTFASPWQRTDAQIAELLTRKKAGLGFSEFPIIPKKFEIRVPDLSVQVDSGAKPPSAKRPPNFMLPETYLFHATQDGTLHFSADDVTQGSFLAYYQIRTTANRRVLQRGMLYNGAAIEFPVKKGTAYYLEIPSNAEISYHLTMANSALAEGGMIKDTLHLYGRTAPIQIMSLSNSTLVMQENSASVTITKSLPGAGTQQLGRAVLGKEYRDIHLHQLMDNAWKFRTGTDAATEASLTQLSYNDAAWKTISATDWWQNQGFTHYFGAAWYRKTFNAPSIQGNQQLLLYLGAIDGNADIYLNSYKVAEHRIGTKAQQFAGWNKPLTVNLTPHLQAGQNILAIKVTSKEVGNSGIYAGAGLFLATDQ